MDYRGDFFDYDPLTGLLETYEETSDGVISIHTYQDVEPLLDYTQKLRNEGLPDEAWKEKGGTLYAAIPLVVQGELLKRGIDVYDPNDLPRVVHEINTNYPYLKTTYKHHEVR